MLQMVRYKIIHFTSAQKNLLTNNHQYGDIFGGIKFYNIFLSRMTDMAEMAMTMTLAAENFAGAELQRSLVQ